MNKPYFSVIIPALNEEKYLPKLLKDLSGQTYRDFEVVLVDGYSDDKTVEVFKEYASELPKQEIIISKVRNVAHQRNLGGKRAYGKYLVFFDADIRIASTFLEEVHLASIKQGFKYATTWISADSNKSIDKTMALLANLGQELSKVINKPFSGGFNTIVTKEVFEKVHGYREDLKINEDQDLAIRVYKKGIDVVILQEPKVIFSYRRYRSEGRLTVLRKYAKAIVHLYLKGPITHELFEYEMGGHVHRKRPRKINFAKLNTYLAAIEKLEKKVVKILSE
ncbi:hypothetical protein A3I51_02555 [Candidatus Gottesmanbacteria bacterium RIFCSPLOWO2_02_FULL_38_8]|uniref:Glycosyltransferase 2-like domain-containing protein n=1 Tax=Candidatus Gottesmanbacteria bacterium RIFCSPLOWO2_02_FULL_38_8 TaxID=1798397 RepID=A0A1F6B3S3_9BACT|nr:MAG: hypothetical protein A3I51_02555 [Candidatus Gottesmanbacteria bacterium RIFCSPLOWO2_02_FULL_38_8]